jgi:hypothetical protein
VDESYPAALCSATDKFEDMCHCIGRNILYHCLPDKLRRLARVKAASLQALNQFLFLKINGEKPRIAGSVDEQFFHPLPALPPVGFLFKAY